MPLAQGIFRAEIAAKLSEKRAARRKRFREQLLRIPEIDGSFVDSHKLGKR